MCGLGQPTTLLSALGIEERLFESVDQYYEYLDKDKEIKQPSIDYDEVDRKLAYLRKDSLQFLTTALKNLNNE